MPLKLRHILLTLCYVLAWLLPLVHEHEVEVERAEHRLCIAEYSHACDAGTTVLHKKCRHHHHDDDHCAICQSGQSVRQSLVLVQNPVLPTSYVSLPYESKSHLLHARQLLWHAIQPRAP